MAAGIQADIWQLASRLIYGSWYYCSKVTHRKENKNVLQNALLIKLHQNLSFSSNFSTLTVLQMCAISTAGVYSGDLK